MSTPYTKAQIKGARKRIQNSLTGLYAGEEVLSLIVGTEEHKVALAMSQEENAQITAGRIYRKKTKSGHQFFVPVQDTFPYKRIVEGKQVAPFKWRTKPNKPAKAGEVLKYPDTQKAIAIGDNVTDSDLEILGEVIAFHEGSVIVKDTEGDELTCNPSHLTVTPPLSEKESEALQAMIKRLE